MQERYGKKRKPIICNKPYTEILLVMRNQNLYSAKRIANATGKHASLVTKQLKVLCDLGYIKEAIPKRIRKNDSTMYKRIFSKEIAENDIKKIVDSVEPFFDYLFTLWEHNGLSFLYNRENLYGETYKPLIDLFKIELESRIENHIPPNVSGSSRKGD